MAFHEIEIIMHLTPELSPTRIFHLEGSFVHENKETIATRDFRGIKYKRGIYFIQLIVKQK